MNNKTVVDAVNALHGDLEFATQGDHGYPYLLMDIGDGSYWLSIMDKKCVESGKLYRYICTINEFNQCVAEMSEGIFVPDCKLNVPEIQYDKDGNGWEVGAIYEFSNDKIDWYQASFSRMDSSLSEYKPNGLNWHLFARECQSPIGKIHKKPIELVDGAAYQFEAANAVMVGFYNEDLARFRACNNPCSAVLCELKNATNIIRLVPEVKL